MRRIYSSVYLTFMISVCHNQPQTLVLFGKLVWNYFVFLLGKKKVWQPTRVNTGLSEVLSWIMNIIIIHHYNGYSSKHWAALYLNSSTWVSVFGDALVAGDHIQTTPAPTHTRAFCNGSFKSSPPSTLWPFSVQLPRSTVHTHIHVRGHPPILLQTVAGSRPDIRRTSEKRASEQSWVVVVVVQEVVVVVEGVAGGGCNELHSKLKLRIASSRTEESFEEEKEGFRPQLGKSGREPNKLKMWLLRTVLLLVLSWTCQGGATNTLSVFLELLIHSLWVKAVEGVLMSIR